MDCGSYFHHEYCNKKAVGNIVIVRWAFPDEPIHISRETALGTPALTGGVREDQGTPVKT
jgi:hypothetical protein